jgi:3-methyl-2-oxobutanoate hydroxymethyltransferase
MADEKRPRSVLDLLTMKKEGRRIVVLTAYDALFARLLVEGGADLLLVGDSVNQVLAGADSTLSATLDQMIYHGTSVRRGSGDTLVFIDLPFMTYQVSIPEALRNAGRVMQETGAHGVKLEGGSHIAPTIKALVEIGIPVMGHIGLTPQSYHQLGGFKVQGREQGGRERLINDALALEEAGVYAIVLEAIPSDIAREITERLSIPTIGIGAGVACDGQVLVSYDMLGMDENFKPRFVRRFATLGATIKEAVGAYVSEVRGATFPSDAESFAVSETRAVQPQLYSTVAANK